MKRIKVYMRIEDEQIVCMCMRSQKLCEKKCERDQVLYDEYRQWQECQKNKKGYPR